MNQLQVPHGTAARMEPRGHLLPMACLLGVIPIIAIAILLEIIPSISLLTVFLAGAAAGFVLLRTRGDFDLLHPIRVFGFVWCFCLALASLRLVTAISVWGLEMWFYVFSALVSFVGGFWLLASYLARARGTQSGNAARELPATELLPVNQTLVVAASCVVVGMCALAYQYREIGEIPIFARNIDEARTTFVATASQWSHPEFNTLLNKFVVLFGIFCKFGAYLATIVLVQKTPKTKNQLIVAWSVLLCGLMAFGSSGGRGFLFEYVVVAATLFHYLRRRVRLREMVQVGMLLILFISFAGYYRMALGNSAAAQARAQRISNLPQGLFWDTIAFGYFSMTCPMEVFYRLTRDLPAMRRPSAGYLFYAFHRFVPREDLSELAVDLYTGEMITSTFLGEIYADFGAAGVFLGPLIFGLAYGYGYSLAMRYRSLYLLCAQAMLLQYLVYFPHVNFFSQNVNWFWDLMNMAWLIWLAKSMRKRVPLLLRSRSTMASVGLNSAGYSS